MDNKLNGMLKQFLGDDIKNEEELEKKIKEFMEKYNNGELEHENTPLDDAYELLAKASEAKSTSKAIKLAKQAYEKSPACFDAILFQTDLEENGIKRMKMLDEGLEVEKNRLTAENYFDKKILGNFMVYLKQGLILEDYLQKQDFCWMMESLNKLEIYLKKF